MYLLNIDYFNDIQYRLFQTIILRDVNLRLLTPVDRGAIDFADHPDIRNMLLAVLNKPIALLTESAIPDLSLVH